MSYNGLGTRLTSSALGITTQYASDGQLPLTISSGGSTTTILYGLGAVAEKLDEWNVVLTDGYNVPRQLSDMDSDITMSARYNPWGKPIETDGIGNFEASFIGTLIDATTGLIYVGNGQYYDPETGRFLTRSVNPDSTNPYIPFDPTSFLLAPLGLMAAYYGSRKSKKYAPYAPLLVFMVILPVSIGLACGTPTTPVAPSPVVTTPAPEVSPVSTQAPAPTTTQPSSTATLPPPTESPTDDVCPCGPETREAVIEGVTRVLYKEGASSFEDFEQSKKGFEHLAWATRSIKIHPQKPSDEDYETLVKSGRYSAAGEYGTAFGNEEPYKDIARRILSEKNPSQVPPEMKDKFIQWMSPQAFPRRAVGNIQIFVDPEVPNCGWDDPQICQLPDLRYRNNFTNSAISSLTDERFIALGELDPYDTHTYPADDNPADPHDGPNDGKVVQEQNAYFKNECYWVGMYFFHQAEHTALNNLSIEVKNNYPYPIADDANKLSCP